MTITASCGHVVQSADDLVSVEYASEVCDAVEGFLPATVYAVFCPECASAQLTSSTACDRQTRC